MKSHLLPTAFPSISVYLIDAVYDAYDGVGLARARRSLEKADPARLLGQTRDLLASVDGL